MEVNLVWNGTSAYMYSRNSLLDAITGDRPRAITAVMVGNCIDFVGELYETSYGLELSEGLKPQAVIGGVIRKHISCGHCLAAATGWSCVKGYTVAQNHHIGFGW